MERWRWERRYWRFVLIMGTVAGLITGSAMAFLGVWGALLVWALLVVPLCVWGAAKYVGANRSGCPICEGGSGRVCDWHFA